MKKIFKVGKVIGKITVVVSVLFGFLGLTGCGMAIFMNDEQWNRVDGDNHSDLVTLRKFSREKLGLN